MNTQQLVDAILTPLPAVVSDEGETDLRIDVEIEVALDRSQLQSEYCFK